MIAIDPGVKAIGVVGGRDGQIRLACASVSGAATLGAHAISHVEVIALNLRNAWRDTLSPVDRTYLAGNGAPEWLGSEGVFCESMEIRPADPIYKTRDLVDVQTVGMLVSGMLSQRGFGPAVPVPVSRWKSSIPKTIHHKRILDALTPSEREIVDQACSLAGRGHAKEVLDAAGLFLYCVNRIDNAGIKRG